MAFSLEKHGINRDKKRAREVLKIMIPTDTPCNVCAGLSCLAKC